MVLRNEITLSSRHISVRIVSPGKTGAVNLASKPVIDAAS